MKPSAVSSEYEACVHLEKARPAGLDLPYWNKKVKAEPCQTIVTLPQYSL